MNVIQIVKPNQVKILDLPSPEPGDNEILIKVMTSGICGTDIHILRGEYMGDYPIIPGHEFSGIVQMVGSGITRFLPGDRVTVEPNIPCDNCEYCLRNQQNFCRNWRAIGVTQPGGMAQWVVAPEKSVFPIGNLSFEMAAFMEPLSCVLHGVDRLKLGLACSVLILGAGPIGILMLQVVKNTGAAEIAVVERNPTRADFARSFGPNHVLTELGQCTPDAYDVVIDATGVISVMESALGFVRPGGKILLFGVPPSGKKMALEAFHIFRKGVTVLSSFTSLRNSYQALAFLQNGIISVEGLVSHRLPLSEFLHGVELIEKGSDNVRKVQLIPN